MSRFLGSLCAVPLITACYVGWSGSEPGPGVDGAADDGNESNDGSDDGDDGTDDDDPANADVSPSGLARLTRLEYERSVTAIFGKGLVADVNFETLPPDGNIGRFETNAGLNVNIDSLDAYRRVAEDVGAAAGANASTLLDCPESPECVDGFIRDYGLLIYRRPLTDAEVEVLAGFWDASRAEGTVADAMRLLVSALLQTPDFLYRLERGADGAEGDVRRLTGYEVASRLSYFLWRSCPDRELLDAAEAGMLDDADGIDEQAERMLADPRADYTILRFYTTWLGIDELEALLVDEEEFPEFEALRDDMREETEAFLLHVFREDDALVSTLFSADYSFASEELAAFYGDGVAGEEQGRLELNPKQRRGILTQASFLTTHARTPERAPIYRGKSILVDMFCVALPPPPDVGTVIDFDTSASARQQIEEATSGPACFSCHSSINPLGFLFENYDALGRWRTMDGEFPVDAAATVLGTDIDGDYADAVDFLGAMAESEQVQECVSRQWLRFALSRPDGKEDNDSILFAAQEAGGDMRALVGALTRSDAFRYRRLPAE